MNLASSLGRAFLLAGTLPAIIFVLLNRLILWPSLPPWLRRLPALPELGIDGAWIGLGTLLVATLLLALNAEIIQLFEGESPWARRALRPALARQQARHAQRLGDLLALRAEAAQAPPERLPDIQHHLARAHDRLLREGAAAPLDPLPLAPERVRPTALGNIWATIEAYGAERYGLDGRLFWPHLVTLLPDRLADLIGDEKVRADFWLNLSLLLIVFAAESVGLGLLRLGLALGRALVGLGAAGLPEDIAAGLGVGLALMVVALLAGLAAWLCYRFALATTLALGALMKSAFDLYRGALRAAFDLPAPDSLAAERAQWARLADYLLTGEPFFYPTPQVQPEATVGGGS